MWSEVKTISSSSFVVALSVFLQQLVETTTLVFVGRTNSVTAFEGIGLAQMWLKICCEVIPK